MSLNAVGVGVVLSARDLASGVIDRVERKFMGLYKAGTEGHKAMGRSFDQMKTGIATMGVGIGVLAGLAKLADVAGDFELSIAKVGAISRASTKDLELLRKAAIKAGIDTQFSPQQAAEGLGLLAQQGFNAAESIKLLGPALDLAAGGSISIEKASSTTAAAVNAFSLSMDQATGVADKMLLVSNMTALSAGDLESVIGTVSRGASLTKQTIDEMLPAVGLVRNVGVQASVAASSVSRALEEMAKKSGKFKALGVDVTDAEGKFKPFMDIVLETSGSLDKIPNAADRTAKAVELFGARGVLAYTAVSAQLKKGVKDQTGAVYQGADAIKYLREQMAKASDGGGAAAKFREQLLNTFSGQKTLLDGSMKTLGVALGAPLSRAFKPVVETIIKVVNRLIDVFNGLSKPVQGAIAKGVIFAAIALVVVGALTAAIGAFGALRLALAAANPPFAGMIGMIGPAIAILAVLALAVVGLKYAVDNNIGGLGDKFAEMGRTISMVWDALVQLFTDGGFSGKVREEMDKTENGGIRSFAIKVYLIFNRIKNFLKGIGQGFGEALDRARPTFEKFSEAITKLGAVFGFLGDDIDPKKAGAKFDAWGEAGAKVGDVLGAIVEVITGLITIGAKLVTGFVVQWTKLGGTLDPLYASFAKIGEVIVQVFDDFGLLSGAAGGSTSTWEALGAALANTVYRVFSMIATVIGEVANLLKDFGSVFGGFVDIVVGLLNGDFSMAWMGVKKLVFGVVQGINDMMLGLVQIVLNAIDALAKAAGIDLGLGSKLSKFREENRSQMEDLFGVAKPKEDAGGPNMSTGPADEPSLNYTPVPLVSASSSPGIAAVQPAAAPFDAASVVAALRSGPAPQTIVEGVLQIDGETAGRLLAKAQGIDAARSGGDVPMSIQ